MKALSGWGCAVVVAVLAATPAFAGTVTFADPVIEQRVRSEIGVPSGPIDDQAVLVITELEVEGFLVADLGGLEALQNLQVLRLRNNAIVNLGPLAGLTDLTVLDLGMNNIVSITNLSGLVNLRELYLDDNLITTSSAVTGLGQLRILDLANNDLISTAPFEGLTLLQTLDLENNGISDATPLVENPGLGVGDTVNLLDNPVSQDSLCNVVLPLRERGATVLAEGECPGIIDGFVVNVANGERIDCALITAGVTLNPSGIAAGDLSGNYRFSDLAPGNYTLEAFAPGFQRGVATASVITGEISTLNFLLTPANFSNMGVLRGRITDSITNLALAGVEIEAFRGTVPVGSTRSCADGSYELAFTPANAIGVTVQYGAPGYDSETVQSALIDDVTRDIALEPRDSFAGVIFGVVTDGDGFPIGMARATVKPVGGLVAFTAFTNAAAGAFTIANLADGEYSIHVSSLEHPGQPQRRSVLVANGAAPLLEFEFSIPDGGPLGCASIGTTGSSSRAGDASVLL
ncbi:MAG: carboxypeptidase regulatory-like domain-containing protein, partial [Candidatus Hydrogenedentales bacterium]